MKKRSIAKILFCLILVGSLGCDSGDEGQQQPVSGDAKTPSGSGSSSDGSGGGTSGGSAGGNSSPQGLVLDGPASALMIDGTIHSGTDWNGKPYIGVWGVPFDFKMSNYPVTWAIATAHASMLLKSRDINYSPNAVLSVAIKESSLGCRDASFPNRDGCFQIESVTAYPELQKLFSDRFKGSHANVIQDSHFESSAISFVYYTIYSLGMFYLDSADPAGFFKNNPTKAVAQQKMFNAAYNRGLWWSGLKKAFDNCTGKDVADCFVGEPNANIAIDHADAIVHYTQGLDKAAPFDQQLTLDDLTNYWGTIKVLYPTVDQAQAIKVITDSFNAISKDKKAISFHNDLATVLQALITFLPPVPTLQETTTQLCKVGYLWTKPPCS
ncbi:MAG: hypothetical protein Q7S98_01855 [Deltaproteobacteria bacterium]|nr:hypothetical protein [Deltaproteobacteria bacterium]